MITGECSSNLTGIRLNTEESDARIIMHVKDMALRGSKSVLVRCSDTDVLVLCISFFHSLEAAIGLKELWV